MRYEDVKQYYSWRRMKNDIVGHDERCLNYLKVKYENQKPGSLLQSWLRYIVKRLFDCGHSIYISFWRAVQHELGMQVVGTDLVRDDLDKVKFIHDHLCTTQSKQKSYADMKGRDVAFIDGERVLLRVSPMKGVVMFGKKEKLSPRSI
ncbi:uncharacterized protein LOC142168147 [Nicotiana tabacum]|uniref:Uncharacterized protein LOC142168147 n=1 Tax=Nicotiana tabacum TaxID=4097 RepID=A0AC58SIW3_TOBAC